MRKFALYLLLSIVVNENLSGQNSIGLPEIINYTKQHYGAGSQNWDVKQDAKGIMYFGNSEGLLSFDGSYWKLYPLHNKTVVRSIEIGPHNRIYIGAQNEIGYFSPNKSGYLTYKSLLHLLPEKERSFTDVWNIVFFGRDIFFRASNKILKLSDGKFSVYPNYDWRFMGICNNRLIAQDHSNKILEFVNDQWIASVDQSLLPKDFLVTSFTPFSKNISLITTLKNGVYLLQGNTLSRFETPVIKSIAAKNIYKTIELDSAHLLLSTSHAGGFIIDKKGNLVQSFSSVEGLQNNNIRHAFLDRNRNLWLGLDNGIDFLAYDNAIKHINPDKQNEGGGYAAIIYNNAFYIGTSNGLYSTALDNSKNLSLVKGAFSPVPGSEGQVWNLSEVNGQLLMGHHEGSFVINNNTATHIDNTSGFWNFFPLYNQPSPIMIAGNYKGVNFYKYENGRFSKTSLYAHFESSRIIAMDNGNIWVAHPYKGIYKVTYNPPSNPTYQSYSNKGLSSRNHHFIYKIRNKIVVPSGKGFYEYNEATDAFQPSGFLENILGKIDVSYMREDKEGNIWFISEKKLGVVDFSGPAARIIYIPELNGKLVSGFEYIYPINLQNVLIGGEKGFYHINFEQYRSNKNKIEVLISSVKAIGEKEKLIFGGHYGTDSKSDYTINTVPALSYKFNSLHFEFSSVLFGNQPNIEYSYKLEGFDKQWANWSKKTEKEYTNLPPGTYAFTVKARNNLGNESRAVKYTFTVLPPWYRSTIAYFLYTLLLTALIFFLYRRQKVKFIQQRQKYEEEQKRLQYLHQLEIERNEQAIVKLKNEKLESEINYKNKELAAATMHLVQKGELMAKIREELMRSLKNIGNENSARDFKKVIRMMTEDEKFEEDWEHFAFHFDRVHGDFLMLLKQKFPILTNSELKLCAYLRMNLSTKEMAQLMNISVRGVEVSRYRLRKKLQIPTDVNLFDYLTEAVKDPKDESKLVIYSHNDLAKKG